MTLKLNLQRSNHALDSLNRCIRIAVANPSRAVAKRRHKTTSTVNDEEVKKFSAVGAHWWDKTSRFGTGPLHNMNPCRVSFIRDSLAIKLSRHDMPLHEQLKGLKILDVGCGGGLLSEALSRLGAEVTSVDPSQASIDVARKHASVDPLTATINYRKSTVGEVADSGEKFDVVCSLEVIEHVEMPLSFVKQCVNCLQDDGSLFLSTISRTPKSFAIAILGAEYITRIVPPGNDNTMVEIKEY